MQDDRGGSWRMSVSDSQLLDRALLVRSASGIRVEADDVPPDDGDHVDLARAWLSWWRRLIDFELRPQGNDADQRTRMRRRVAERARIFDPPEFASLVEWPALQAAAATAGRSSGRSSSGRSTSGRSTSDHFAWSLTRDVVDEIVAERGVRPDQIDAVVLVLDRPGSWWHLIRPGAAICCSGTVDDPVIARELLQHVMASSLNR